MKQAPRIVVVGSLNVDQTLRVPRIPAPGETLLARGALTCFGGKGANQAVAAARAGGRVRMIGCVGDDDHGVRYQERLVAEGIDPAGVITAQSTPTGSAFITVDDAGENTIVVHSGANHELSEEHVDELSSHFEGAAAVLLQLECPLPAVVRAAEVAKAAGATVILNPSPWRDGVRGTEMPIDVLIVNETEAQSLAGGANAGDLSALRDSAECEIMIVTRGANSTRVASTKEQCFEVPPPPVTPVDTVGAGDAFAGAFAVAWADGSSLLEAVTFANCAAALATLKPGAQDAIPGRDEILKLVSEGATTRPAE